MIKIHHANRGIVALAAYVAGVAAIALVGYEVGARQLGYSPPSEQLSALFGPAPPPEAEVRRYGRMWLKVDNMGNCREYTVDNRTQQMVDKGIVTCDPARKREIKEKTTSRFDSFRDAFGGK
ncbi:MAG: hypothetical protein HXX10_09080 [Rhodoplanes sp.]|uniref:hypothetical protein n=1 Tax=Rhodoplanes sp. TaxID=1968906 RepID=UPI00178DEAB3|nr:hypothetical protein [Rhodoplanes sp.]NVO14175.1 hypothetical protein [Rhodoplanes sp.]